jgi:hypothetical protein
MNLFYRFRDGEITPEVGRRLVTGHRQQRGRDPRTQVSCRMRSPSTYFEIIPIVRSQVSTN